MPIVFVNVADPVGSGFVDSLARPGGNATGFVQFEYNLSGKWLELLKEIAPRVTRAAVLRDPALVSGIGQFAVIQSAAPSVGVEVSPVNVRDAAEIERTVAAFARPSNSGLIVTTSALTVVHRDLIISLAARHKLPAIYYRRYFVTSGGLMSYGYDVVDHFRRAAGYVDRILKGEKPADLPVQAADQVRVGDQPQDGQGARPRSAADVARPRRRGDRIEVGLLRLLTAGFGTFRTSRHRWIMSVHGGEAVMPTSTLETSVNDPKLDMGPAAGCLSRKPPSVLRDSIWGSIQFGSRGGAT